MIKKYKNYLFFLLLLLAGFLLLGLTVEKISLRELTNESDIIVLAKVKAAESFWEGNNIYTYTDIEIINDIKGNFVSQNLKVKQIGGTVGEMALRVDGTPELYKNDEVVLFLRNWKGNYWIHSIALGCYFVADISGKTYALNDFNRFEFKNSNNKLITEADVIKPEYELSTLINEVKNILNENGEGD